jgi:hypothetical protein
LLENVTFVDDEYVKAYSHRGWSARANDFRVAMLHFGGFW